MAVTRPSLRFLLATLAVTLSAVKKNTAATQFYTMGHHWIKQLQIDIRLDMSD